MTVHFTHAKMTQLLADYRDGDLNVSSFLAIPAPLAVIHLRAEADPGVLFRVAAQLNALTWPSAQA